jgi:SOS response regulatory protein OraA/RecX
MQTFARSLYDLSSSGVPSPGPRRLVKAPDACHPLPREREKPNLMILKENKNDASDPFGAGMQLLARRAYSVAEMRRSLRQRFGEEASVNEAVRRLRQLGLLDDRKFSLERASSLARHRGFGPERIRRELRLKQVSDEAAEAAIRQTFEEISESELLERALEKKLRIARLPLTRPQFYSLCQSLRRLGFHADDIMKAMREKKLGIMDPEL